MDDVGGTVVWFWHWRKPGVAVHTGICNHRDDPEGKAPGLGEQEPRPHDAPENWNGGFKEGHFTSTEVCMEMPYSQTFGAG